MAVTQIRKASIGEYIDYISSCVGKEVDAGSVLTTQSVVKGAGVWVPKAHVELCGQNAYRAMVLSWAVYWSLPNGMESPKLRAWYDSHWWIAKPYTEWENEIGIKERTVRDSITWMTDDKRPLLIKAEAKSPFHGGRKVLYTRINWQLYMVAIEAWARVSEFNEFQHDVKRQMEVTLDGMLSSDVIRQLEVTDDVTSYNIYSLHRIPLVTITDDDDDDDGDDEDKGKRQKFTYSDYEKAIGAWMYESQARKEAGTLRAMPPGSWPDMSQMYVGKDKAWSIAVSMGKSRYKKFSSFLKRAGITPDILTEYGQQHVWGKGHYYPGDDKFESALLHFMAARKAKESREEQDGHDEPEQVDTVQPPLFLE